MSVIILDFKGQYCQLIARRVRELGVFSKILPGDATLEEIKTENPSAIILTGGPDSVYEKDAIHPDKDLFTLEIPMLGICYGAQLMSYMLGGVVQKADPSEAEYGKAVATYKNHFLTDSKAELSG